MTKHKKDSTGLETKVSLEKTDTLTETVKTVSKEIRNRKPKTKIWSEGITETKMGKENTGKKLKLLEGHEQGSKAICQLSH